MEFILEREASGRLLPKYDARVIKTEIYLDTAMDYVQVRIYLYLSLSIYIYIYIYLQAYHATFLAWPRHLFNPHSFLGLSYRRFLRIFATYELMETLISAVPFVGY